MVDRTGQAVSAAATRAEAMLPMLELWVRENSYSASVEGVNRMGEHLVRAFDELGLEARRIAGNGVGDHLVWTTRAFDADANRRVVLIGHHDTVFPPGSFEVWERDGDRLRGPGVLDMKGGLATVWAALGGLADAGLLERVPVALVSVGDEEIGSADSKPHVQELARGASAALVFEAGRAEDRIITQRKGTGGMTVTAIGKAAHAGNNHKDGKNAIWAIARLVCHAQALTDYDGGITVNVGLISGGEARNTVPGEARCGIDFRFETRAAGEAVVSAIRASTEGIAAELGVSFHIEGGIKREPLERSDASAALYREYAEHAAACGLGTGESPLLGGGSDANTVSAVGVPAIDGLGPRGKGFHTHDEFIEVSTLTLRAQALARFLAARAG